MSITSLSSVWHVAQNVAPTVVTVGSQNQYDAASLSDNQIHEHLSPATEVGSVVQNLLHVAPERPIAVFLDATPSVLLRLVPYLPLLAASPVVLHIATSGQHSDVLLLRQSGLTMLYSSTASEAQDYALVAHQLASSTSTGVVHFYDADKAQVSLYAAEAFKSIAQQAQRAECDEEAVDKAFKQASESANHPIPAYHVLNESESTDSMVVALGNVQALAKADASFPIVSLHLVRPLLSERLVKLVPASVDRLLVLEQTSKRTTRLAPVFVDIAYAFQHVSDRKLPSVFLSGQLGSVDGNRAKDAAKKIQHALQNAQSNVLVGGEESETTPTSANAVVRKELVHERGYDQMLRQIFKERLSMVNAPDNDAEPAANSPEFAFGKVLSQMRREDQLVSLARKSLDEKSLPANIADAVQHWLDVRTDRTKVVEASVAVRNALGGAQVSKEVEALRALEPYLDPPSRWIIGNDAWAYDAGMGGVHHVIASGRNVNMLIFDTVPYTGRENVPMNQRKKDIGLYAMNYGNTYVASTALYSDYTQVLHSLMEADKFNGPSIILAYVPYHRTDSPALDVLRETKLAVDSGYWPLYRWDPSAEARNANVFRLDSVRVREQLRHFLDRHNQFSLLASAKPELSYDLAASQGTALREKQQRLAKQAYDQMLGSLEGPPLLVLFASDAGGAEKAARRLATRAKLRGLGVRVMAMDDFPLDDLSAEKNVVFITSTAGQGEPPQNGRITFKALAKLPGESFNEETRFGVFGMGDSHYWPRPEDAGFYNKPAKDLDKRLAQLGAQRLVPVGLGDDQDADGWQTGYKIWEPLLWKALGVDTVEVTEAEPEPITNENIKIASNYLRGTILEGLADTTSGRIAESDTQLTKFHGTYMQYDRDTFDERKAAGLEPSYGFMIRVRMPGGVCTPEQWLQLDQVAEDYGGIKSLKITTRQTVQYHMIVKQELKKAMQSINKSMLDTIAACGDVNRNVMCAPNPKLSEVHEQMFEFSKKLSDYLLPRMNAYHEIWLDKTTESSSKMLVGGAVQDYEPMYGHYYLPRKFKIAIAIPPRNDVDVFANDVGLIAIADPDTKTLLGFNLAVGGGMGVTHSMKATYPRLGSVIGFLQLDQVCEAVREVMFIQRDTGNRQNRKQARLKYTIDNYWGGADNFRKELERRLGYELQEAREYHFTTNTDDYGWEQDYRGKWHCTLWLENGRVIDEPGNPFRTGLRELAKFHKGTFRLTPNQHIIVSDVDEADKARVEDHLREYKMDNWNQSGLRLSASACVAFPTCGLAMAESERYIFKLVDKVQHIYLANGLRDDEITFRMTGCPNGCARPWIGEIAFVGKAPGTYVMLLGGARNGTRLNKIYRDNVQEKEILEILGILIPRYAQERLEGEPFGDWVIRAGIIAETTHGAAFYDNVDTETPTPRAPAGVTQAA
ncbi:assimilatory sulfite reductase (NADPH) [Malassezia psittaci]|uniref:assimilatory sulfite reductase (NADPH) n=1 Tax=Malassezia psittaci TaxID=1821823 RepID=A0AAF0F8Z5_9BASI|nr:assimilatory sulfite reductase (NADPH) [Malassezia psittaci]